MGMGLSLNTNGHNVVFVGGTGILVFLDIVAKLILQNCQVQDLPSTPEIGSRTPEKIDAISNSDLITPKSDFGPSFKLTLYYAAPSEDQAIGLELC